MNKKIVSILFATGLIFTSVISANAGSLTKTGTCNSVGCSAVLSIGQNNSFSAGTYANQSMQNISVILDGDKEWWADTTSNHDTTSALIQATIASGHAYSTHHADNARGDAFDRGIDFDAGVFS